MSDPSQPPESESTDSEPQAAAAATAPRPARNTRLMILLVILVVGTVAILYDYRVARPAVNTAYDKVTELSSGNARRSDGTALTRQDIKAVLNREPSETLTEYGYEIDVYSWISGLPMRRYEYFVVYVPQGPRFFVTHFKNVSRSDVLKELDPNKFGDSSLPRSMAEWREHVGDEVADEYMKNLIPEDAQAPEGGSASDGGSAQPAGEN